MPCFRPLTGFRQVRANPATGKFPITFTRRDAINPDGETPIQEMTIPCGQCRFCRLEHSRQWAVRCAHESQLYTDNCFITLTYSDDHLPKNGSLDYDAPVLFMKRLRKQFGAKIRSFGCAEYGELLSRPHYHICIFNFDFDDKKVLKKNAENTLYCSEKLSKLWPYGHASVGALTFESAAYVARYVTKKITGEASEKHYETSNPSTGEISSRLPERAICVSRRPGIGKQWYEKFGKFVRDHDLLVLRGKKMRPAKYYDRLYDIADPAAFRATKLRRKISGIDAISQLSREDAEGYTNVNWSKGGPTPTPRLYVMEECLELKLKLLKRGLENG